MATTPKRDDDVPRSDDSARSDIPPAPDEDGPHDVPDDEVIEQTLPARKPDSQRPR